MSDELSLTHLDDAGNAHMVDISEKALTQREAIARGSVAMQPATIDMIVAGGVPKGDVFAVARVAGVMAAKQTSTLIPLCHQLALTYVAVTLQVDEQSSLLLIEAKVRTNAQTGVEMEALTAVSVAALTVYDMCKGVDKTLRIGDIHLVEKQGGSKV